MVSSCSILFTDFGTLFIFVVGPLLPLSVIFFDFNGNFNGKMAKINKMAKNHFLRSDLCRGEYFSEKPIFLHIPQKWPCTGILAPPGTRTVIFLHEAQEGNISAHSSNISAQNQKKAFFYAQLNKKLAKSTLYHIIHCFACFSMI